MRDLIDELEKAFPPLANHPILMARLCVALIVLAVLYAIFRKQRKKVCASLLSKLSDRMFSTSRLLYVYQETNLANDWKYYTSERTGQGRHGDDMIWTLVSWPSFRPKDSVRLRGVVGKLDAIYEAQATLLGRWEINHDPSDRQPIGILPARGLRSLLRRAAAWAVYLIGAL